MLPRGSGDCFGLETEGPGKAPAPWYRPCCALVQAFIPPSTVRVAPVMYEDSGPATNATNAATSSTCP